MWTIWMVLFRQANRLGFGKHLYHGTFSLLIAIFKNRWIAQTFHPLLAQWATLLVKRAGSTVSLEVVSTYTIVLHIYFPPFLIQNVLHRISHPIEDLFII